MSSEWPLCWARRSLRTSAMVCCWLSMTNGICMIKSCSFQHKIFGRFLLENTEVCDEANDVPCPVIAEVGGEASIAPTRGKGDDVGAVGGIGTDTGPAPGR